MRTTHVKAAEIVAAQEPRVMVVYATRYGSTREVAQRMARRIQTHLQRVDVRPTGRASDVGGYEAAVIGSPVYNGSWLPEALEFVRRNRAALSAQPVWLFSVGALGDEHRLIGPLIKREPKEIDELRSSVHLRGYRVFAGAIEARRWPQFARYLYHLAGGRFGDNRDWAAIDRWADAIAAEVQHQESAKSITVAT